VLQDKAKVSIEFDIANAKKQLDDTKKSLDDTSKQAAQKIEKTKEGVKTEEKKEMERQTTSLKDKLRRIAEMPQRMLAPDVPERIMGMAPFVGPGMAFYWKERDNLELAVRFAKEILKDVPGLNAITKTMSEISKISPDAEMIRKMKARWESLSKTLEDVVSAYTGTIASGQIPSAEGSETFITRLYEYNSAMAMWNKNRRFLQQSVLTGNIADILTGVMRKGPTGGSRK
jgi:DNA repair exonuclease SbcCD ATPase subunit